MRQLHNPSPSPSELTPSKTQRKLDMHRLQKLGERLLEMPAHRVDALQLPDNLADAIRLARRITAREGLRRQLQYIGRLMRTVDEHAIRAAVEHDGDGHRAEVEVMHAAEDWRTALLENPNRLSEFVARFPAADSAELTSLLRSACAEHSRSQPGRNYRELYRAIRDLILAQPLHIKTPDKP